MILAIDYDNTYTVDPDSFNKLILIFKEAGHTVICVTARPEVMGKEVKESIGQYIPIVFANGEWKRDAAKKHGYNVNVWIDDSPEYIAKQFLIGDIVSINK